MPYETCTNCQKNCQYRKDEQFQRCCDCRKAYKRADIATRKYYDQESAKFRRAQKKVKEADDAYMTCIRERNNPEENLHELIDRLGYSDKPYRDDLLTRLYRHNMDYIKLREDFGENIRGLVNY